METIVPSQLPTGFSNFNTSVNNLDEASTGKIQRHEAEKEGESSTILELNRTDNHLEPQSINLNLKSHDGFDNKIINKNSESTENCELEENKEDSKDTNSTIGNLETNTYCQSSLENPSKTVDSSAPLEDCKDTMKSSQPEVLNTQSTEEDESNRKKEETDTLTSQNDELESHSEIASKENDEKGSTNVENDDINGSNKHLESIDDSHSNDNHNDEEIDRLETENVPQNSGDSNKEDDPVETDIVEPTTNVNDETTNTANESFDSFADGEEGNVEVIEFEAHNLDDGGESEGSYEEDYDDCDEMILPDSEDTVRPQGIENVNDSVEQSEENSENTEDTVRPRSIENVKDSVEQSEENLESTEDNVEVAETFSKDSSEEPKKVEITPSKDQDSKETGGEDTGPKSTETEPLPVSSNEDIKENPVESESNVELNNETAPSSQVEDETKSTEETNQEKGSTNESETQQPETSDEAQKSTENDGSLLTTLCEEESVEGRRSLRKRTCTQRKFYEYFDESDDDNDERLLPMTDPLHERLVTTGEISRDVVIYSINLRKLRNIGKDNRNSNQNCDNNDNDDDVQIIENSTPPILIVSDDDDEGDSTHPTGIRSFARKSTSRPNSSSVFTKILCNRKRSSSTYVSEVPNKRFLPEQPKRRCLLPQKKNTEKEQCDNPGYGSKLNTNLKSATMSPDVVTIYDSSSQTEFLRVLGLRKNPNDAQGNPRAFAAQLNRKKLIIPNAFYSPQQSAKEKASPTRSTRTVLKSKISEIDRNLTDWLRNFIECFSSKRDIAYKESFSLLERFVPKDTMDAVRAERLKLNKSAAVTAQASIDQTILKPLYAIFFKDPNSRKPCQLTPVGRSLCTAATSSQNRIALTLDMKTKIISSYTRGNGERLKRDSRVNHDDKDYVPKSTTTGGSVFRHMSARVRKPRNYYSHFDDGDGSSEVLDIVEDGDLKAKIERERLVVQKKCEQMRLEAKRQSLQQAKSFENAFIEMFGVKQPNKPQVPALQPKPQIPPPPLIKIPIITNVQSAKDIGGAGVVNISSTPTATDTDFESLLEQDGNKEHRIYKVVPTQLIKATMADSNPKLVLKVKPQSTVETPRTRSTTSNSSSSSSTSLQKAIVPIASKKYTTRSQTNPLAKDTTLIPEVIISDDEEEDAKTYRIVNEAIVSNPDNSDPNIFFTGDTDMCLLCPDKERIPNIVGHYVNEHPDSEVYVSRITPAATRQLLSDTINTAIEVQFDGKEVAYSYSCVFCTHIDCVPLSHWREHLSMHTGEFAYKCNACDLLCATTIEVLTHLNHSQQCRDIGRITKRYHYNAEPCIEAFICLHCNYIQLNEGNLRKHLVVSHDLALDKVPQAFKAFNILRPGVAPKPVSATSKKKTGRKPKKQTETNTKPDTDNSEKIVNLIYKDGGLYKMMDINDNSTANPAQVMNGVITPVNIGSQNRVETNQNYFSSPIINAGNPNDLSFMICGMLDTQLHYGLPPQPQNAIITTMQQFSYPQQGEEDVEEILGGNPNDDNTIIIDDSDDDYK